MAFLSGVHCSYQLHCKLRPNTEGQRQTLDRTEHGWHAARFQTEIYTRGCHWIQRIPLGWSLLLPVGTVNSATTLKARDGISLTMNSATLLMASHNTEGKGWDFTNHELCHPADGVTQH
jgi:hypothetical protein